METIPLNERVLDLVAAERSAGRKVYLASASDGTLVESLASHVGLFDGVFASDGTTNLSGVRKADALVEAFGERGFDYVGNAGVDLEVWARPAGVIGVRLGRPMLEAKIGERYETVDHLGTEVKTRGQLHQGPAATPMGQERSSLSAHAGRACRYANEPYHARHRFRGVQLHRVRGLRHQRSPGPAGGSPPSDQARAPLGERRATSCPRRGHSFPRCRLGVRPRGPERGGLMFAILAYFAATLAYSLVLKRLPVVDVMILAGLYMARVVAGGIAIRLTLSEFLLDLPVLLHVPRAGETARRTAAQPTGWVRQPAPPIARATCRSCSPPRWLPDTLAVIVLALYVTSPDVAELFTPFPKEFGPSVL